ncbi:MAG: lysophospholipid acyltransferase family protein [Legionellales bacterium]|jgi:1-acyl-sn-glycerol-3-phosphate acyltransferase
MKNLLYSTPVIMLRTLVQTIATLTSFWWVKFTGNATRIKTDTIIKNWARALLQIVNVKPQVIGKLPVYKTHQPYIIMSNHASLYDIPIILDTLPGSIRMIAKKELSYIPYFGTSLKNSEFIFIDRKNRQQAILDLQKAKAKMLDGIIIWAAPEGTRSREGQLGVFKKGIFKLAKETDAIIIPVSIKGARQLLPPKTWRFNPGQAVFVHIGEPIVARDFDETALNARVRDTIQSWL